MAAFQLFRHCTVERLLLVLLVKKGAEPCVKLLLHFSKVLLPRRHFCCTSDFFSVMWLKLNSKSNGCEIAANFLIGLYLFAGGRLQHINHFWLLLKNKQTFSLSCSLDWVFLRVKQPSLNPLVSVLVDSWIFIDTKLPLPFFPVGYIYWKMSCIPFNFHAEHLHTCMVWLKPVRQSLLGIWRIFLMLCAIHSEIIAMFSTAAAWFPHFFNIHGENMFYLPCRASD